MKNRGTLQKILTGTSLAALMVFASLAASAGDADTGKNDSSCPVASQPRPHPAQHSSANRALDQDLTLQQGGLDKNASFTFFPSPPPQSVKGRERDDTSLHFLFLSNLFTKREKELQAKRLAEQRGRLDAGRKVKKIQSKDQDSLDLFKQEAPTQKQLCDGLESSTEPPKELGLRLAAVLNENSALQVENETLNRQLQKVQGDLETASKIISDNQDIIQSLQDRIQSLQSRHISSPLDRTPEGWQKVENDSEKEAEIDPLPKAARSTQTL